MSVQRCGTCREYFWHYRGAPFRPWCSFDCWWNRHKRVAAPEQLREDLREHLREVHGSDLPRPDECEVCEYLDAELKTHHWHSHRAKVYQFVSLPWERKA